MGWSCTKKAMDTFQKVSKKLCIGKVQNVYCLNGISYMIELSCEEHEGSITGTIFNLSNWKGKPCNSFKISPEGKIERGPKVFFLAEEDKDIPGLANPDLSMFD